MSAYTTPQGTRFGDPAKWYIYKSRWTRNWIVMPPLPSLQIPKRENTFQAAVNYLIEQLARAQT